VGSSPVAPVLDSRFPAQPGSTGGVSERQGDDVTSGCRRELVGLEDAMRRLLERQGPSLGGQLMQLNMAQSLPNIGSRTFELLRHLRARADILKDTFCEMTRGRQGLEPGYSRA
jgi:hypothetical protein